MIFISGTVLALLAAFLFGISPVLIKSISGELPPIFMAAVLYLGAGTGLLLIRVIRHESIFKDFRAMPGRKRLQLAGAIISGGILAPICLTYGILYSSAFQVSALLNLETVATTLIAGLIFHEHISGRVWGGKALIIAGAVFISVTGRIDTAFSPASLMVAGACIFWGFDNNLTRDIEELPPSLLAGVKCLIAGIFNLLLAFFMGQKSGNFPAVLWALIIGMMSYGFSLLFFIYALRKIGASRTGTYFAAAPFIGMLAAVVFWGERPSLGHWMAGMLILLGIIILALENHEHEHTHEAMEHSHPHVHDEHHQHEHDGSEGPEPHEHVHKHKSMTHSHKHWPDIHHRHRH